MLFYTKLRTSIKIRSSAYIAVLTRVMFMGFSSKYRKA